MSHGKFRLVESPRGLIYPAFVLRNGEESQIKAYAFNEDFGILFMTDDGVLSLSDQPTRRLSDYSYRGMKEFANEHGIAVSHLYEISIKEGAYRASGRLPFTLAMNAGQLRPADEPVGLQV